jgi:hypothetical protein
MEIDVNLQGSRKPTGRPSSYTFEVSEEICRLMAEGKGLRQICALPDMPSRPTVLRWIEDNPSFRDRYARARELCMDWYQEEVLRIAFDDSGDLIIDGDRVMSGHHVVQRARLKVDTVKWVMSKLAPKKYGDRPVEEAPQGFTISWLAQPEPVVAPPPPPKAITYQPEPLPADLSPEAWAKVVQVSKVIERIAPGDEMPEDVLAVVEAALRQHYLSTK